MEARRTSRIAALARRSRSTTCSRSWATAGWRRCTARATGASGARWRSRSSTRTCATRARSCTASTSRRRPSPSCATRTSSRCSTSRAEDEPEQYLVVELAARAHAAQAPPGRTARCRPRSPPPSASSSSPALAHAHATRRRPPRHQARERDHRAPSRRATRAARRAAQALARRRAGRPRAIVKLTDFGIAKLLDAQGDDVDRPGARQPGAHGARAESRAATVDARADVFGIGVLLYECMVGHLPVRGEQPRPGAAARPRRRSTRAPSASGPPSGETGARSSTARSPTRPPTASPTPSAMRDAVLAELARLGVAPAAGASSRPGSTTRRAYAAHHAGA